MKAREFLVLTKSLISAHSKAGKALEDFQGWRIKKFHERC